MTISNANIINQPTLDLQDLRATLEPLLRQIVREELERIAKVTPRLFYLRPQMPLYEDLLEIQRRQSQGKIKLHSHTEVWHE